MLVDLHVASLLIGDELMMSPGTPLLFIPFPASEAPAPKGIVMRIANCYITIKNRLD